MAVEGVDYSTSRPDPKKLAAAGKQFVVRYGGPGTDDKHLHADELKRLTDAGISVVANAEGVASGFKGFSAGKSWAQSALTMFRNLGMPEDRPIYFSVDWDAGVKDWSYVDDALDGAASVLGKNRVGVYGSYYTLAHAHLAGTATWYWQTFAWSGGKTPAPYTHLYQYRNGVNVAGGDCDLDRALRDDYGQWGVEMTTVDLTPGSIQAVADAIWVYQLEDPTNPGHTKNAGTFLRYRDMVEVGQAQRVIDTVSPLISALPNAGATANAVLAALGEETTSNDEIAAVLKAVFGARLPEIIAALQK